MRREFATLGICAVFAAVILHGHVFGAVAKVVTTVFGGGDEAAALKLYAQDRRTQEVSNGADPLPSLQGVVAHWASEKAERRLVVMGNSQTYAVILAPGERDPGVPVRTYVDLVGSRIGTAGKANVYRLSAPNLSYAEALWYVTYLSRVAAVKPTDLVLQLNYESFRKSGIRDGMLGLLRDPAFASAATETARSATPFGAAFEQAIKRYRELEAKSGPTGDARASAPAGFGEMAEVSIRKKMDAVGIGTEKHAAKAEFLNVLYLLRVHVLKITPTTPRPLAGAAYEGSVSALDEVATRCRAAGITVRLFLAPQNPGARMWRTEADRDRYRGAAQALSSKFGLRLVDLEKKEPAEQWGVWIDGPDPIHFGLKGHETMAAAMLSSGLF